MTSSNNRRGGRLVLFDRMIINSFTPSGRSHTGYNFLWVDQLYKLVVLCDRMIVDSFTPLGRSHIARTISSESIDRGGLVILCARIIIDSLSWVGRSHTGHNFLWVDRPFLGNFSVSGDRRLILGAIELTGSRPCLSTARSTGWAIVLFSIIGDRTFLDCGISHFSRLGDLVLF